MRALCLALLVLAACHIESWRDTPPQRADTFEVLVPAYTQRTLPNGLTLTVHPNPAVPLVSLQVVVRAGDGAMQRDQAGVMRLLFEMMARKNDRLIRELDALGAELKTTITPEGARFGVMVSPENAFAALQQLVKMLREPSLDAPALERVRPQVLAEIFHLDRSPMTRAAEVLQAALHGPEHALSRTARQTMTAISKAQLEDMAALYQRFIGPKNVAIVIVGRLPTVIATAWTTKLLGDWTADAEPAVVAPPPENAVRTEVFILPLRSLPSTLVAVGGIARIGSPKEEAALHTAIGLFTVRLRWDLLSRGPGALDAVPPAEVQTFGGFTQYTFYAVVPPSSLGAALTALKRQTQPGSAIPGVDDGPELSTREQLHLVAQALLSSLIDKESASAARLSAIAHFVRSLTGLEALSAKAAASELLRRPPTYSDDLFQGINTLTFAALNQAVERHLKFPTMQIVLVGDPDVIEAQLRPLQLGTVRRVSAD